MLAQLTPDRRYGVRQEVAVERRVELGGGPDEGKVGHLLEVLVADPAPAVALGHRAGDGHVELHDLVEEPLAVLAAAGAGGALEALGGARHPFGAIRRL